MKVPGMIVAFRNEVQKALFDIELAGQISDGNWENATPHDHWKPWCTAETIVDPVSVGREGFYPRRDYYGFSSPQLLDVVEGRMLAYARMTLKLGIEQAKLFSDVADIDDSTGHASISSYQDSGGSTYWADKRAKCEAALRGSNLTIEQLDAICTDSKLLDHKRLVRELRDMSKIIRFDRKNPGSSYDRKAGRYVPNLPPPAPRV